MCIYSTGKVGVKCYAETKSELQLEFEKTNDLAFLNSLYQVVHNVFSFICNRQNITLEKATIVGERIIKHTVNNDGKTTFEEKILPTNQSLVIIDTYKEAPEADDIAAKTVRYQMLYSHFEQLFALFLENRISLLSIHSSIKAKHYFDLKQCLNIAAAFEYYERTFLPEISSQTTIAVCNEVKAIVAEYANKQIGKKKRKANDLLKSITPSLSLKEKIVKVYDGYDGWTSLKEVLDEWYDKQVDDLADVANVWRNELAHEKRTYDPDERIVTAIRLVEHLNYCIVMRQAGYTDNEIRCFIKQVLSH